MKPLKLNQELACCSAALILFAGASGDAIAQTPEELEAVLRRRSLADLAKDFADRNAEDLMRMLRAIEGAVPTINASGNMATFEFTAPIDGKKTITFKKVGKYWYLPN